MVTGTVYEARISVTHINYYGTLLVLSYKTRYIITFELTEAWVE